MSAKSKIMGTVAALAVAGGSIGGIAVASSAPASAAVTQAAIVHQVARPHLYGPNYIKVTYQGHTYTYWTYLWQQRDGLLRGYLYDGYLAAQGQDGWLAVHGDVSGNVVVFEVTYPAGDAQGSRAFVGNIDPATHILSGNWDETGSEAGTGTFAFVNPV